jgi:hypothetical protein
VEDVSKLGTLAGMAMLLGAGFADPLPASMREVPERDPWPPRPRDPEHRDRPEFPPEELARLRAAPTKAERKRLAAELKAKYARR